MEEKFRKAMIQTAQLDNEKSSFTYQVELLKDRLEDLEEAHSQLQVGFSPLLSLACVSLFTREFRSVLYVSKSV